MPVRHPLAVLVAVLVLAASPADAQKRTRDLRPMVGAQDLAVPTFPTVQSYLDARAGLRPVLRDAATRTTSGTVVPLAAPVRRQLGALQSGPAAMPIRIERAPNGTVRWMEGELRPAGAARVTGTMARVAVARDVLATFAPALALDSPADELTLTRSETDALGQTHVRFAQTYGGVPVWNAEVLVHLDADGAPFAVHGTYHPTPQGAETAPTLTAGQARDAAVADLAARGRWRPVSAETAAWLDLEDPAPRLVLYRGADAVRPAYALDLHASLIETFEMVVDAATGEVLERIPRHCSFFAAADAPDVRVSAPLLARRPVAGQSSAGQFLAGQGTDLNGVARQLRIWRGDDGSHVLLSDLDNLNAGASQLPGNPAGGALTVTANNTDFDQNAQITQVSSASPTFGDPASVSSSYNMDVTYAYFRDTFGRKAIDDAHQSMISIVHVTDGGRSMANAFWSGRVMAYGDGDGVNFRAFAGSLDVSAHEMSHGVIQHTADLVYKNQPGALNESIADVFGIMVDRDDFLSAEEIAIGQIAGRDLENPDNPALNQPQPAHMSQFQNLPESVDNGGVHVNSGITNKAAVLVIKAIGRDKTEQIWYRGLSTYLTRESQFVDARLAFERAARDLHGDGSAEAAAVSQAFAAVGIGGAAGGGGGGGTGGGGDDLPPLTGGQSLVAFLTGTGAVGVADVTDPQNVGASLFPGATARFSTDDASQVSAPSDGASVWFVDAQGRLAFADTQTGAVSTFDDLFVQQPGDLWTASISPDAGVVAFVSAYLGDPRIYLYDGQTLGAVELLPETTVEGIRDQTISFPDVVGWSPNPAAPLVIFDAFHEARTFGGSLSYWALHEIDLAAGRIYDVLPPQPEGVNIGNPTYSKTDPDVLAFDVAGPSGLETYVVDFTAGSVTGLGTASLAVNGTAVTDAQRPSFAPDDRTVVVSSPATASLFFVDRASLQAASLTFTEPVYNPTWFTLGGTPQGSTPAEAGPQAALALAAPAPNPFRTATRLAYSLGSASAVRLTVFDALGREVARVVDGERPAGDHVATWDASGLAGGVYLVRLDAAGGTLTRTVTVAR